MGEDILPLNLVLSFVHEKHKSLNLFLVKILRTTTMCIIFLSHVASWQENMVLGLVGETIDVGDEICGARVVDKSKNNHNVYRFELWLRSNDNSTAVR